MLSEICHSWKFGFCDRVFCQGLFISGTCFQARNTCQHVWLILLRALSTVTLTWPLRRPVNKSGPSSLSVTLQPTVTRPKETPTSFGPSHYTPKPFSNTVIDRAITRVRQNKYKSSAHAKHMIFMARHWTEKFCILLMSVIHIFATINTLWLMQMNNNSVEVVFKGQTTPIEWYIFWDQIQYQRYSVLKDADGAWSKKKKKKKMRYMFTVWCSLLT